MFSWVFISIKFHCVVQEKRLGGIEKLKRTVAAGSQAGEKDFSEN